MSIHSQIEREKIEKAVDAFLAADRMLSVFDGEAYPVKKSRDKTEIMDALGSTDMDVITVRDAAGSRLGSMTLIYGNGIDVISDWSDLPAINAVLEPLTGMEATR